MKILTEILSLFHMVSGSHETQDKKVSLTPEEKENIEKKAVKYAMLVKKEKELQDIRKRMN